MTIGDLFLRVDRAAYEDEAMPEYPGLFLGAHVIGMSELVGTFFGASLAAFAHGMQRRKSTELTSPFSARFLKYSRNGVLSGAVMGALMVLGKATADDMGREGIADRAYRIKANKLYPATQEPTLQRPNAVNGAVTGAMLTPAIAARTGVASFGTSAIAGAGLGGLVGLAVFSAMNQTPKNVSS